MNATLLIQAIVRQTTVLIATLATASGQRAQLASVANVVFADLVRELREQGLGNKVIADMFGLALRTYHRKLARLSASQSAPGRSLWEAVLAHIQQHGPMLRSAVMERFARDDDATLRAVVLDLVEAGLVRREGSGDATRLEAVDPGSERPETPAQSDTLEAMVLVALHRHGPLDFHGLGALVPAGATELAAVLERLHTGGLIERTTQAGKTAYACERYLIQFGDAAGWEAAVFDHYQALVTALVTKLRSGERKADLSDAIGGSTFAFDLWRGHPMQAEVLGYLKRVREQGMALRKALEEHNAKAPMPDDATALRVTAYVGQSVIEGEEDDA